MRLLRPEKIRPRKLTVFFAVDFKPIELSPFASDFVEG